MNRSDSIKELAGALVKAQASMAGAKKDSENPHFRSKYADLASVWEACRKPLTDNGLSVIQSPRLVPESNAVEIETLLLHVSGEFVSDSLLVPLSKPDAQGVGSGITYARRYALSAFVGIAPEDDDAESATDRSGHASGAPGPSRVAEDKPPIGAGSSVVARVIGILPKSGTNAKGPWTKWTIKTTAGSFGTFDKVHEATARMAMSRGTDVELTGRQTQFGMDLLAIQSVTDIKRDEPLPLDEEPPF